LAEAVRSSMRTQIRFAGSRIELAEGVLSPQVIVERLGAFQAGPPGNEEGSALRLTRASSGAGEWQGFSRAHPIEGAFRQVADGIELHPTTDVCGGMLALRILFSLAL